MLKTRFVQKAKTLQSLGRHPQRWLALVLVLLFTAIIASHVQAIQEKREDSDLSVRYRRRIEDLDHYRQEHERLSQENDDLMQRRDEAIEAILQREGQEGILAELQHVRTIAGLTSVNGPGIRVVLDDKPGYDLFLDSDDSIVHDGDIRHVLDLLRNAGAAAMSVNEERIVNSSFLYCIGPTILCNQQRLTPPYVIKARGDPQAMQQAIERDGTLAIRSSADIGLIVEAEIVDDVSIPAFREAGDLEPYIDRLEVVSP